MEKKQIFNEGTEIDLKSAIIYILLRWKMIVLSGVIAAFFGCIVVLIMGYKYQKNITDTPSINEEEKVFYENTEITEESIRYYLSKQNLTIEEISDISNALNIVNGYKELYQSKLNYLNNSELMKSDNIYCSETKIAIDSDDNSLNEKILEGYKACLMSTQFLQYLKDNLNLDIDLKYLNEIIKLNLENETNLVSETNASNILSGINSDHYLTITIYNTKEDVLNSISNLLIEWLNSNYNEIKEANCNHQLIFVSSSIYNTINRKYLEIKDDLYSELINIPAQSKDVENNLSEIEDTYFTKIYSILYVKEETKQEDKIEMTEISYNYTLNLAKYGLMGFIVGIMVSGSMICLKIIFSDLLQTDKELIDRYGLNVIAGIQCNKSKYKNPIDKMLLRVFYKNNIFYNKDDNINIIASLIKKFLYNNKYKNILITGKMNREVENYMIELKECLVQEEIHLEIAESIINNSNYFRMLENIDGAILLETIGESCNNEIKTEINMLKLQNINIVGVIAAY
ncbi:MAG: hypothetical protein ACERKZ_04090 [Lachnotalea sp.]